MSPRFGPDFELLDRFIERLEALTSDQWESLARSLDHLRGDDVRTMWRRARHNLGAVANKAPRIGGFFATMTVAARLVGEFHASRPSRPDLERRAAYLATLEPEMRDYLVRAYAISEIAERHRPGDEVLAEVVSTAARALQYAKAPGMTRSDVEAGYASLEPFIPLDSL